MRVALGIPRLQPSLASNLLELLPQLSSSTDASSGLAGASQRTMSSQRQAAGGISRAVSMAELIVSQLKWCACARGSASCRTRTLSPS